jgi:hypothetical protein
MEEALLGLDAMLGLGSDKFRGPQWCAEDDQASVLRFLVSSPNVWPQIPNAGGSGTALGVPDPAFPEVRLDARVRRDGVRDAIKRFPCTLGSGEQVHVVQESH